MQFFASYKRKKGGVINQWIFPQGWNYNGKGLLPTGLPSLVNFAPQQ